MANVNEIVVDGVNYTKEVREILADKYDLALAIAEDEQVKLMQAEQRLTGGERKNLDFGYLRFKLCPEIYNFWKQKIHDDIWSDNSFKKWMENRFGRLIKINSVSNKIIVPQ